MAISLAAATLGAAVIGGGASALGASKNAKATKKAAAAQADSTAQQLAYQREADATARGALSPYIARGNVAGETYNALLGLGGTSAPQQQSNPGVSYGYEGFDGPLSRGSSVYEPDTYGGAFGTQFGNAPWQQEPTQTMQPAQVSPAQAATNAYEIFKQSTGYQSRFNEGNRALNASFAGSRMSQSGAAVKSALRYGQNFASGEFGNYLGYLGNQQNIGFQGAGALGRVAVNGANNMGAISQNQADNTGDLAVARANNSTNLYANIAGFAGNALTNSGALSSYRAPKPQIGGYGDGTNMTGGIYRRWG